MRRLFQMLGADWDPFKALVITSVRMDFRGSWSHPDGRKKMGPIVRSLIFYSLMGTTLSASLVMQVTPFLYALLTLSYSMVMMALAVILEFGHSLIHPDDAEILLHRPVTSRTYFLARLANLLFFVSLIGTALCLMPSLFGLGLPGVSPAYPLLYFIIAWLANVFSAALVVLFYTALLQVFPYERTRDIVGYIQIGFTFVIFFAYQLIPRAGRAFMATGADVEGAWLYAVPSAWFAGALEFLRGSVFPLHGHLGLVAIVVALVIVPFSFRRISLDYAGLTADLRSRGAGQRPTVHHAMRKVHQRSWKNFLSSELRAGFDFTNRMIRRDRSVKMALYPMFGLPLAFLAVTMIDGGLSDPFTSNNAVWRFEMSDMTFVFILFMIYNFIAALPYNRDWEAGWIFGAAPLQSPGRFYRGVKLSILVTLIIPFFIILILISSFQIPFLHGLRHGIVVFLLGLVIMNGSTLFINAFPFTKAIQRGARAQRFAALAMILPFMLLLGWIQTTLYRDIRGWSAAVVGLLIVALVMDRLAARRLNKVLRFLDG